MFDLLPDLIRLPPGLPQGKEQVAHEAGEEYEAVHSTQAAVGQHDYYARRHEHHQGPVKPDELRFDMNGPYQSRQPEYQCQVADVRAHHVAQRYVVRSAEDGIQRDHQLRSARPESDYGQAHRQGRHAEPERKGCGAPHQKLTPEVEQHESRRGKHDRKSHISSAPILPGLPDERGPEAG